MDRSFPETDDAILDRLADIAWSGAGPGTRVTRTDRLLAVWWVGDRDLLHAYVRTADGTGFNCQVLDGREVTPHLLADRFSTFVTPSLSGMPGGPVERTEGWSAMREVMAGLDPGATLAMVLSGEHYVVSECLASGMPHARRMQAFAVAHPWLLRLGCRLSEDGLRESLALHGDADVAASLLAEVSGGRCTRDMADFLVHAFGGDPEAMAPTACSLDVLASLPRDFVSGDAWHPPADVAYFAHVVASLARATGRPPGKALGHAPRGPYGAWLERRAGRSGRGATLGTALSGLNSMLEAFTNEVLQTARAATGVPLAPDSRTVQSFDLDILNLPPLASNILIWALPAVRILAGGMTAPALLELAARWHARATAIGRVTAALTLGDGKGPPPLTPDVDLGGDEYLTCLVDAKGLLAEGDRGPDAGGVPGLGHCVSSYAPHVLAGRAHILSLRRRLPGGGFERLSTVEVSRGRLGLAIVQHRGRRNAAPDPDLDARVRSWLDAAGPTLAERLPPRRDGPLRPPLVEAVEADPSAWEALRDAWAFALPRPLRAAGPAEFLAFGGEPGGDPYP